MPKPLFIGGGYIDGKKLKKKRRNRRTVNKMLTKVDQEGEWIKMRRNPSYYRKKTKSQKSTRYQRFQSANSGKGWTPQKMGAKYRKKFGTKKK